MRLFNSPFTKTGEVRYFELFKIFVLVMSVVMSFSFLSNQIEVHSAVLVSTLISVVFTVISIIFVAYLGIETKNLFEIVRSYILPLISFGYNVVMTIKVVVITVLNKIENNIKVRSYHSSLCVMRC